MNFESPWWLVGVPLVWLLAWLRGRRARESAFLYSSIGLVKGITQLRRSRAGRILMGLRWFALTLVFIGLSRPQLGHGNSSVKASGIDIVVALDLSPSMAAEDFESRGRRVNRVEIAKEVLEKFIDQRKNDRIGLVAFAKQAFVAAPLTLDHDFLFTNLKRLDMGQIGDGTAIGSALTASVNRLRGLKSKSRIVILMTDGQDNSSKVPPLTAAEAAQALGVKVYTIGVGTHGTAPFPQVDPFGRKYYVRMAVDIDEDTLKQISAKTGGKYYRADNTETLKQIYADIDKLERSEVEAKKFQFYEELYGYFVVPAAALFLLELLLSHTVWRKLP